MPKVNNMEQFENAFANIQTTQPTWLNDLKASALESFKSEGFPSRKSELWRYVNLKALTSETYNFQNKAPANEVNALLESYSCVSQSRLVFINGKWDQSLSENWESLGIVIQPITEYLESIPQQEAGYFTANEKDGAFENLNTALFEDGLYIEVPKGKQFADTLQIIHLNSSEEAQANHIRNLIRVEENANVQICESFSSDCGTTFSNIKSDIVVKGGAKLKYVRIMDENLEAKHINSTRVYQFGGSVVDAFLFNSGGELSRHNFEVNLLEEGAHADVNGFYMTHKSQVVDNHIYVNHAVPNCTSSQLFKGILNDSSRAVFDGMVFVAHGAKGTESEQLNKNLLLKSTAEADSKPQLEIYNDDVSCSHGSTLGQLNRDELFYLESRAIPPEKALHMLLFGFAEDVIFKIDSKCAREKVIEIFRNRFTEFEV